jgi:hypothetical protein
MSSPRHRWHDFLKPRLSSRATIQGVRALLCLGRKRWFSSYVDAPCEVSSFLNGDGRHHDISIQGALTEKIEMITCVTAAKHLPEHDDILGCDICRDPAVASNRHPIVW